MKVWLNINYINEMCIAFLQVKVSVGRSVTHCGKLYDGRHNAKKISFSYDRKLNTFRTGDADLRFYIRTVQDDANLRF